MSTMTSHATMSNSGMKMSVTKSIMAGNASLSDANAFTTALTMSGAAAQGFTQLSNPSLPIILEIIQRLYKHNQCEEGAGMMTVVGASSSSSFSSSSSHHHHHPSPQATALLVRAQPSVLRIGYRPAVPKKGDAAPQASHHHHHHPPGKSEDDARFQDGERRCLVEEGLVKSEKFKEGLLGFVLKVLHHVHHQIEMKSKAEGVGGGGGTNAGGGGTFNGASNGSMRPAIVTLGSNNNNTFNGSGSVQSSFSPRGVASGSGSGMMPGGKPGGASFNPSFSSASMTMTSMSMAGFAGSSVSPLSLDRLKYILYNCITIVRSMLADPLHGAEARDEVGLTLTLTLTLNPKP